MVTMAAGMRTDNVEIFSDDTNMAVMRHPARRFPGTLIQGDSLHSMCSSAERICGAARVSLEPELYEELHNLRNTLWSHLVHYKSVLIEHGIPLPFSEI